MNKLTTIFLFCLLAGCGDQPPVSVPGPQGDAGTAGSAGSTGAQGNQGPGGDTGATGSQGSQGDTGQAASTTVTMYDFLDGDCKLIEGERVERTGFTLRVHPASDFTCIGAPYTILDSDDEIYWINGTTLFMLNTAARLFVLKF